MSRPKTGPSLNARENIGGLFPVVESIEQDGRCLLVLGCPGQHRVAAPTTLHAAPPKKGRCKLCPKPTCGATNRDGVACTLEPKHKPGGLHEGGGRSWTYDARTLAKTA